MFSKDLKQHPGSGPATKACGVFGAPGSRGLNKFLDIGYRNDACGLFEGSGVRCNGRENTSDCDHYIMLN